MILFGYVAVFIIVYLQYSFIAKRKKRVFRLFIKQILHQLFQQMFT